MTVEGIVENIRREYNVDAEGRFTYNLGETAMKMEHYESDSERKFAYYLKGTALNQDIIYQLRESHDEGKKITVTGTLKRDGLPDGTKGSGIIYFKED